MPAPVGYENPTSSADADARSYRRASIQLYGTHRLVRLNLAGHVTRSRYVNFGSGRIVGGRDGVRRFSGRPYLQITEGVYAGWWTVAPVAKPTSSRMLGSDARVRLPAGVNVGFRFFRDSRIRTRVNALLASATEFTASRRAVFGGRAYYRLTSGPLAERWVAAASASLVAPEAQPSGATQPLATWRVLALVYRETDVTFERQDGSTARISGRMSDSMRSLVLDTFDRFRASARGWSNGMAGIELDVVHVPHAVTRVNKIDDKYWLGPDAVADDIDTYAPAGRYDSVFVVWKANEDSGEHVPVRAWGMTLPPGAWANRAGYSSVIAPHWEWWWTDAAVPEEVFVHEWLHQVIFWHENNERMRLDLHSGQQFGYDASDGTWRHWLSDVMRGQVRDGDSFLGVKPALWAVGTPRET